MWKTRFRSMRKAGSKRTWTILVIGTLRVYDSFMSGDPTLRRNDDAMAIITLSDDCLRVAEWCTRSPFSASRCA